MSLQRRGEEVVYEGSARFSQAGQWRVAVTNGLVPDDVRVLTLDVQEPAAERRDPRANPQALQYLATATGGAFTEDPAAFVAMLPDLRRERMRTQQQAQWDRWWVLLFIVGLLSVDWAIRRNGRLP